MKIISEFQGEYRWLSNFWECRIILDGDIYTSVEAAYVASKTDNLSDRKIIRKLASPGECKRYGKTLKLKANWENEKLFVMKDLLRQKFARGSLLAEKLLKTGDAILIEGNGWGDIYWGVCNGVGENNLGKLIMEVRSELKNKTLI